MDFVGVKDMLDAVNNSNISYFEYKTCDGYIVMDKSLTRAEGKNRKEENVKASDDMQNSSDEKFCDLKNVSTNSDNNISNDSLLDEDSLYLIKSPMVGTFYRAQGEGKEPFVSEGKQIKKGDIVCIIEAMKLMNEIESDVSGEVVEVLVKDGEMVEYDQPLFKIKEN